MTQSAGPALRRLHERFERRVAFVSLYVREAHPGSRFPQPRSMEEKMAHARAFQLRGLGSVDEVLGESGGYARADLAREVPPMFAMARLAGAFGPLPPLGRGIAALVASLGAGALLAIGAGALIRRLA